MQVADKKFTGFIFQCSSSTQDECLERMLFGETEKYKEFVELIKPGDILFLYNVTNKRLFGEFIAKSEGKFEIEPQAWSSSHRSFPWQVRVGPAKEYNPLVRDEIEDIVKFNFRYPQFGITDEQVKKLRELFERAQVLPSSEKEFRTKYPQDHRADDGHFVRSQGELNIDNWLFHNRICHGYERKLPFSENVYCDFFIPFEDKKGFVYIEYWGREDERYQDRKKSKVAIYNKHELSLIQLNAEDLENLDDVMPNKLRTFFKNLIVY